jgi:hypothetical protein
MRARFITVLCAVILFLGSISQASADLAPNSQPVNAALLKELALRVVTIRELANNGTITQAQADQGTKPYLARMGVLTGKTVTQFDVATYASANVPLASGSSPQQLTALQKVAGYVTFTGFLTVILILAFIGAFLFLFGKMLIELPVAVYEVLLYIISVALIGFSSESTTFGDYLLFGGCLLLAGAMGFSTTHHKSLQKGVIVSAALTVAWSIIALMYQSSMVGFISVAALLSTLGFSIVVTPMCYAVGFKDDSSVGKATNAAFLVLGAYVAIRATGTKLPEIMIFESGALLLGSIVGYLGLLIMSSRWFDDARKIGYVGMQLVTVTACVGAVALGSIFGISELQKVGGTVFCMYLIEKIFEIKTEDAVAWAFKILFASGVGIGIMWYIRANDFFAQYLF